MSKINRKLAATILLAALEFRNGQRSAAKALLTKAAADEDFEETMDGLGQAISDDDFDAEDEGDLGSPLAAGLEDMDEEIAAIVAPPKGRKAKAKPEKAATTDISDNELPGADEENDNDEDLRGEGIEKELARTKQVRANLIALASAD